MSSPMNEDGPRPTKKKLNHNRVSMLAFSDEAEIINQDIEMFADFVDQPLPKASRRRSSVSGRRRSSLGGLGGSLLSESEQARITEMYKTVIQMSSENKLTEKNSWSFDLIDHMGRLIRDESKTVNFQKASCTLDASVKIYSNRVDDTYASSHRILESLSRGNTAEEVEPQAKVKVGSKASSARLHLTDTIERNPENLNVVKLEHDYAFDPMFQKLSKAFDEGGAKGMLLYNMRVSPLGASLSFLNPHTEVAMAAAERAWHRPCGHDVVDMADLVSRSSLTAAVTNSLCISEKLSAYHSQLGHRGCDIGVKGGKLSEQIYREVTMRPITMPSDASALAPVSAFPGTPAAGGAQYDNTPDSKSLTTAETSMTTPLFGDYPEPEEMDFADYDQDQPEDMPMPMASPARGSTGALLSPIHSKLQWTNPEDSSSNKDVVSGLLNLQIDPNNDYAYIANIDQAALMSSSMLNSHNAWAGARHWKYATRQKKAVPAVPEDEEVAKEVEDKPKKKATKAKDQLTGAVSFSLEEVDSKLFDAKRATKRDSTVYTAAAERKLEDEKDLLLLPGNDEKLTVKDLCRLHSLPHIVVSPRYVNLQALLQMYNSNKSNKQSNDKAARIQGLMDSVLLMGHHEDHLYAQGTVSGQHQQQAAGPAEDAREQVFEDDYGGAGDDYDMPYDGPMQEEEDEAVKAVEVKLEGLQVDTSKFVQAQRVVGKMQIK